MAWRLSSRPAAQKHLDLGHERLRAEAIDRHFETNFPIAQQACHANFTGPLGAEWTNGTAVLANRTERRRKTPILKPRLGETAKRIIHALVKNRCPFKTVQPFP